MDKLQKNKTIGERLAKGCSGVLQGPPMIRKGLAAIGSDSIEPIATAGAP